MRIRKNKCIELNWTRCCTGKFNVALSLCGVLGAALYFSEGFLEVAAGVSAVVEAPRSLGETVVCFLEVGDGDDLEEGFLVDKATGDRFALLWEAMTEPEVEAFPCFQK